MILPADVLAKKWPWLLLCLVALLMIITGLALSLGAVDIPLHAALFHDQTIAHSILFDVRIPRVILALCVGALLASCGTVTQGLFRNPLADPSIIGVSAGASAGASVVIVLFNGGPQDILFLSYVSLGAFIGGMLAVLLVYRLANHPTGISVTTMLLAGIAVAFLAGALSNILEFFANNDMLRRISLWRMGGMDAAQYPQAFIAVITTSLILPVLFCYRQSLNLFLLGESEARHLGINTRRVKKILVLAVAVGVGVSVAMAGTITFIGLVVPHILRLSIGPDHRFLLPAAAVTGAILLVSADLLARTLMPPIELPVGLLTTLLGVPIFLSLLKQRYRYGM